MVTILKDNPVDGVMAVPCRLNGPRGIVKAFIVYDDKEAVVVDTGFSEADGMRIGASLGELQQRGVRTSAIVLTHAHGDHVGGLKQLRTGFPVPVFCHEAELKLVHGADTSVAPKALKDGEHWSRYGGLRFIHMPGHSAGSLALYHEQSRSLLAGDAIVSAGEHLVLSPPFLSEDSDLVRSSVERLLSLGLDIENVFVAHGDDVYGNAAVPMQRMLNSRRGG